MSLNKSDRPASFFTWISTLAASLTLAGTLAWAGVHPQAVDAESLSASDGTQTSPALAYYQVQKGTPAYLRSIHHGASGCNWMGVAGQVFSADAKPVSGLMIELGGSLEGVPFSRLVRSGTNVEYGPGGFELAIADKPAASQASLWLQVVDDEGNLLSDTIPFDTFDACDRNLIIINFVETDGVPLPTPSRTAQSTVPATNPPVKPSATTRPVSTATQTPTRKPTPVNTPEATRFTPAYLRQPGSPLYKSNFAHPARGCNWLGVAGQVLDVNKKPLDGLVVQVDGMLNGKKVSANARTGSASTYGQGAYEITLAANPSSTTGALYLTLSDEKGTLLSRKEYFSTYSDCRRNLILFNFIQNPALPTFTPVPTGTPQASPTPLPPTMAPSATKPPTGTPAPGATPLPYFEVQEGSPLYVRNLFHPKVGCHWLGIGGQVLGLDGSPQRGVLIEAGGSLAGRDVFALGLSGASPRYGPGGYELILAGEATDSLGTVWIMLRDLQGRRLSDHITLDTYSDCQKNLVYLNLVQTR